jgi:ABC-type lipopolysaccharide export system ATPase subunit
MNKHILELDSVELHFGDRRIFSDVYLQCETGKITALIGRNGSGKSCLMKFAFGTLRAGQGTVRIDRKILQRNQVGSVLSYLPQFSFIPGHIRVKDAFRDFNLSFGEFSYLFPEFTQHYLETIISLPGGARRVLEVYTIIKSQTLFSLLDEPFLHIIPLYVTRLHELMRQSCVHKGLLIADHRHDDLRPVTDRLYLLGDGFLRPAGSWQLSRDKGDM